MAVDVSNVHIFGSDDDALYLGPSSIDLDDLTLDSPIPATLTECGWLSDDGAALGMDDSIKSITGHQGRAEVTQFMDESKTSLTATVLETKLDIILWNLSATAERVGEYARIHAKKNRKIEKLCGVWDTFDTEHVGVHYRYIFPLLALGERSDLAFKAGEISAWAHNLGVLKDFDILTNAPQILDAVKTGS